MTILNIQVANTEKDVSELGRKYAMNFNSTTKVALVERTDFVVVFVDADEDRKTEWRVHVVSFDPDTGALNQWTRRQVESTFFSSVGLAYTLAAASLGELTDALNNMERIA